MTRKIRNFDALCSTPLRKDALTIAEAAYAAIDTGTVLRETLQVSGHTLTAGGKSYDLSKFERVRIIGFGKVSCRASQTMESLLKGHLSDGAAIDVQSGVCEFVDIAAGTHPYPSEGNVVASERIVELSKESKENDLVIVIVSGGGSALLCYPYDECEQGRRLYDDFKGAGANIEELNTVRRHISGVKGGGLAAMLYPATVLALVFSDIAGGKFPDVASGPTYFDETTVADAEAVLDRFGLKGYALNETPKDRSLFARVHNVGVVSNARAMEAMSVAARAAGYRVAGLKTDAYDGAMKLVENMFGKSAPGTAVLCAGEPALKVASASGAGGRCTHTALEALKHVDEHAVFLALASDGCDNSDAAGAIADKLTKQHVRERALSVEDSLSRFDSYPFFKQSGDLLTTGPTGSNVSDLFILLNRPAR